MRVFDAHVHNFWWDRTRKAEGFLEALSATAEEIGIVKIALLGNPGTEGHNALQAAIERYPDLLIGLGWLRLDENTTRLNDEFADRGFRGITNLGQSYIFDDVSS